MYKLEDIKPKHGKPSEYGFYICHFMGDGGGKWKRYPYHEHLTDIYWDNYIDYFIDIPDTPEELMPKKYPENKPSERGKYLCHISDDTVFNMEHDEWEVMKWEWDEYLLENNWNGYRELVDYFIDVNLDVNNDSAYLHSDNEIGIENEMNTRKYAQTNQKENKMEIIWETDELKATLYHDDALIYLKDAYGDIIGCSVDELTAFAQHWLDLQGYDVAKRVGQPSFKDKVLWHDKHIEITDLDGLTDIFMIASISSPKRYVFVTDEQLAECHKAVEEREPEWLPCPNPICEQTKYLEVIEIPSRYAYPNKEFIVECKNCGYRGGRGSSEEQAVKLHNLIADNAKRSSLCEPENEYYGLWCDEDGNVLPRKEK